MSEWIVSLLREAYRTVPNLEDRTAYCMKRQREFLRGEHVKPAEVVPFRKPSTGMVPFSEIADDPVIARLCAEDNK